MSLRDRLRSKKESKVAAESGEFNISIAKVSNAVAKIKNPADLGNIIKEFAKFLNTLDTKDAKITFSGNFDMGQKMLLNCVLGNFLDDGTQVKSKKCATSTDETDDEEEKPAPKLIKKRKSVKERLEKAQDAEV